MVGWHHQLNGHEFEQTPGDGDGQGSLVCCSPWGRKGLDTTEQLNDNKDELQIQSPLMQLTLTLNKALIFLFLILFFFQIASSLFLASIVGKN